MPYNTMNPLGSSDPKDLFDNAAIIDRYTNDKQNEYWQDRFGIPRKTIFGMEKQHERMLESQEQGFGSFINSIQEQFQSFLESSGYSGGDREYEAGITINSHNEGFVRCEPDGTACLFYTPRGDTELPYTTTGEWSVDSGLFVIQNGDTPLRQDLANPTKGASLVAAGGRTQESKNADVVSVRDFPLGIVDGSSSNQIGIEAAVSACFLSGSILYWPAGTYVSTSNIPNFHDIQHFGPGIIKRGATLWRPTPREQDVQLLFVSAAGNQNNDGLTVEFPFTYQEINKALLNAGPVLNGDWQVHFSAGVYSRATIDVPNVSMAGRKLLKFIGPPVQKRQVPLVTFDGENYVTIGARARGQHRVELRDISLFRYKDYGFSGGSQGLWFLNNVHTRDCRIGIAGENVGLLYVSSGVHDLSPEFETASVENHRIMSRFVVKHAIGYSYDEVSGNPIIDPPEHLPILRGNNRSGGSRGFLAQELATGHVNVDVQDFAYGIDVRVSSMAHVDATSLVKRNAYGVRAGFGCNCQIQPAIDFGVGTEDENTIENVVFQGGADGNYSQPFMYQELRVASNKGSHTVTDTTANTRVGPILYTLRSRDFKNEGGLRLKVSGTISGTAGRKTISLMSRGTTLISAVVDASSSGQFVAELKSDVKSYGKQHGSSTWVIGGDTNSPGRSGGRTRETTLKFGLEEYPLELRVELQQPNDSVLIENIELWRIG